MVGKRIVLEEILNDKQINYILQRCIGEDVLWQFKGSEVKPAMDGLAGFLGDHMKAVLHVDVGGEIVKVHLFLKGMPMSNKPKADFINENHYFRREVLMYNVLEEICDDDDSNPWGVKAYICTDSLVVMPDLAYKGYRSRNFLDTLDYEHIIVSTKSIARFHAAFVNYETKKSIDLNRPYSTYKEFNEILQEPTFCDSLWLRACSKLSKNLLQKFSTKSYRNVPDLETKLLKLYLSACDSLTEYKDTLNVLLHKDLWVNNIMFNYQNNVPINAILIDYQCIRYGPPAFDLMLLLYLTTSRSFRNKYEDKIFDYYYDIFTKYLNNESKERLITLGYDKNNFINWCEKARMFGLFETLGIYPYVLMDPKTAEKTFDDPETYDKYLSEDRSAPVIEHALKCEAYRQRNLEANEEFIERYLLKE